MTNKKTHRFQVVMTGDPVIWAHRDAPDYWERNNDGAYKLDELDLRIPREVSKPARGMITLQAADRDEAADLARRLHPEYHTVESVEQIGR